jgi:hypothetical protein
MYEEREAELDRQDSLDALEEERDVAKARSAFYQQQARRYQSREVRAKTYNVGELVLRLPEKKKDKLKPKWEGPFIIDKVLTGGAYRLRNTWITDSSRTHGTQPASEDSMPSAGLRVRPFPPVQIFFYFSCLLFIFFFSTLFIKALKGLLAHRSRTIDVLSTLIIPGGFFTRSLIIRASCPAHVSSFHMYLLFTIICIDMT